MKSRLRAGRTFFAAYLCAALVAALAAVPLASSYVDAARLAGHPASASAGASGR